MTRNTKTCCAGRWRSFGTALALICAAFVVAMAQTPNTPGGATITNTATSSYSDGTTR
jgi:hypothetical protein